MMNDENRKEFEARFLLGDMHEFVVQRWRIAGTDRWSEAHIVGFEGNTANQFSLCGTDMAEVAYYARIDTLPLKHNIDALCEDCASKAMRDK